MPDYGGAGIGSGRGIRGSGGGYHGQYDNINPITGKPYDLPGPGDTTSKPIVPRPISRESGPHRTDTFRPIKEPVQFGYGQMEIGAQVWYDSGSLSDGTRVLLYAFGWGTIGGFPDLSQILVDDKPLGFWGLSNGVDFNFYTGTASPSVDALLTAAAGSRAKAFPYLACAVVRFKNPAVTRQAPNVYRMRALVNQLTYRDPRLDATLVTRYANAQANPALVLADLIHSPIRTINSQQITYGKGVPDVQGDWSGSYTTAANDCDVVLTSGAKRFVFADCFREGKNVDDWIEYIRAHAQLNVTFVNGKYQIWMDKAQSASGITFSDATNLVTAGPLQITTADESPTRVSANFVNPDASYKDDLTPFDDDPGIAGGSVDIIPKVYDFGCIPADQARRLVRYLRKKASLDKRLPITVDMEGAQAMPGTRLVVTSQQAGWSAIDSLISSWGTSQNPELPSCWEGIAELYDAAVYDDSQLTLTSLAPPTVTSPFDTPPDVTGLTLTEELYRDQTGVTQSRIRVAWTNPSGYAHYWKTRITFTRTGFASVQLGEFDAGPVYISATLDKLQYTVTAQTVSSARVLAVGVSQNLTTQGKTTPPADVPLVYAQMLAGDVKVQWQQADDPDIRGYEIRRGTTSDTWATAQLVHQVGANTLYYLDRPPNSGALAGNVWRYFVKAWDFAKNYSTSAKTTDIAVFNEGPALTETSGNYGGYIASDPDNTDSLWSSTGNGVEEGWRIQKTISIFLCRRLSPTTSDTEISGGSYTSIQQWEDNVDAPRRNGQALWAPLDNQNEQAYFTGFSGSGGTGLRNLEQRTRVANAVRSGLDNPDIVTRAEPVLISSSSGSGAIVGPAVRSGPNGPTTPDGTAAYFVHGLQLSSNSKYAQTMIVAPAAVAVFFDTQERIAILLGVYDVVTDVNGDAVLTLPANKQITGTITPRYQVNDSSTTPKSHQVSAVNGSGCTINVRRSDTGAALSGITVRIAAWDDGLGGNFTSFSV